MNQSIPDYLNIELKNKSTLDPFLRRITYAKIELLDAYMTDNIDLLTHEYNVIFRTCWTYLLDEFFESIISTWNFQVLVRVLSNVFRVSELAFRESY